MTTYDDQAIYWLDELYAALAPFSDRGVAVSVLCNWATHEDVVVMVWIDGEMVIDAVLCASCEGTMDTLCGLLWDHRFDLLSRLQKIRASSKSLDRYLVSYGHARQSPLVVV